MELFRLSTNEMAGVSNRINLRFASFKHVRVDIPEALKKAGVPEREIARIGLLPVRDVGPERAQTQPQESQSVEKRPHRLAAHESLQCTGIDDEGRRCGYHKDDCPIHGNPRA